MTKKRGRARYGPKLSVRQRLKHTIDTANEYHRLLGAANLEVMELKAEMRAARYAARWYRKRWIWTLMALIVAMVGIAQVLG